MDIRRRFGSDFGLSWTDMADLALILPAFVGFSRFVFDFWLSSTARLVDIRSRSGCGFCPPMVAGVLRAVGKVHCVLSVWYIWCAVGRVCCVPSVRGMICRQLGAWSAVSKVCRR